ncbi:uncharacterized protein J4E88_000798 [Alternaria novae-zelandiae]|uniref:uncharacterized protein n=1 Tax=Alternaria novae-zelandiae TaxID=430562 RepID=UPI0020C1E6E3|nr:uncharacterized protein J4E88_000798 [Alternaria novae-zelandiae]KAI4696621.1 hypothetical protein J4E88_000798 [Alternaria novae-zelandiae]
MLPDNIANSYREYKADTEIFVTWLVETASRCGFIPSTTAPAPATAGGRLKGKARAAEPKAPKAKSSQARRITINDLKTCASAIAEKPPKKFVVPLYASRAAARAIRHRTKSTLWHETQTQNVDEDLKPAFAASNEAHATFTGALGYVLDLLKPFITTGKATPKPGEPTTQTPIDGLSTRFSNLDIEELAEQEPESGGQTTTTARPAPTSKTTYTVDNQKEDRFIAMSMLIRDYNQIKTIVTATWDHYRQNDDVDLVSAAATTQAAMQMTKSLVNDFSNSFPEIVDAEDFWHKFLDDPKIRNNISRETDENRAILQTSGEEVDEFLCHARLPNRLLNYGLQVLTNALDDIVWMIIGVHIEPPAMDNFTKAWYTHLKRGISDDGKDVPHHRYAKDISIEMMLYTDLYLAVQDILTPLESPSQESPSQESPSQETLSQETPAEETPAEETPAQVRKDYHDLWKYVRREGRVHRLLKAPFIQGKRERAMLTSFFRDPLVAERRLSWLSSDPIWVARAESAKKEEHWEVMPHSLYNRNCYDFITMNPFLAGLILFVAVHATCDLSLLTQNTDGLVLGYAHLFNFLRQAHSANNADSSEKLLTREWEDMEAAIDLLGESNFFKGNRPIALDMCIQRLLRAHGMKASDLARDAGRVKKGTRAYDSGQISAISTPLTNLIFSDGGPSKTTFLNITNQAISELLMQEAETYASDTLDPKIIKGAWAAGPLIMFRVLLQRELPALLFPLDTVQSHCSEINKKIFAALDSTMAQPNVRSKLWMNWQKKGTIPVNLLFYERGYHKQSQAPGPIPKDVTGVHSLPIHEAAEIITDYLDELRRKRENAECKTVLDHYAK